MHNDAVVQGLSEVPYMQDVRRWGILLGIGAKRTCNRRLALIAYAVCDAQRSSLVGFALDECIDGASSCWRGRISAK
jgi:hypothetical protein